MKTYPSAYHTKVSLKHFNDSKQSRPMSFISLKSGNIFTLKMRAITHFSMRAMLTDYFSRAVSFTLPKMQELVYCVNNWRLTVSQTNSSKLYILTSKIRPNM